MRITHVITGLGQGGAEAALFRLCEACPEDTHSVISLRGADVFSERLKQLGVEVNHLDIEDWRGGLKAFPVLMRLLSRSRPDAVQTWMYHADLYGGLAARLAGIRNVCWGLRHGVVDDGITKVGTLRVIKLCALLSHVLPRVVISCSGVGAANHLALGYAARRMAVVPNGLDLQAFRPRERPTSWAELGCHIDSALPVLGMVARYDPYKDHQNLIESLGLLRNAGRRFHCLLAGQGIAASNSELVGMLSDQGLTQAVSLLGRREDVPEVMNALDLCILSSRGEAFPNVLAEAMACGVPCVTTDAGDAAAIVGDTGWVVPRQDPSALAHAIVQALLERGANPQAWAYRKQRCRERVQREYEVGRMARAYRALWSGRGVGSGSNGTTPERVSGGAA